MEEKLTVKKEPSDNLQFCINSLLVVLLVLSKILEAIFLIALVIALLPFIFIDMLCEKRF